MNEIIHEIEEKYGSLLIRDGSKFLLGLQSFAELYRLPAYSPGGMLNAFAWPLTYSDQQRASIVYRADYQGI